MSEPVSPLKLVPGRDYTVRRGHPWIFSGALAKSQKLPDEGALVRVLSHDGETLGTGFFSGKGSIAVKILARGACEIDAEFWRERIQAAVDRRAALGLIGSEETTAFRLFNAEGDGIPGLIIDLYGETAVIQCQHPALFRFLEPMSDALRAAVPKLEAVYLKSDSEENPARYVYGALGRNEVREHGLRYLVDWERGQKTGFFLDQRENRKLVSELSRGRKVLNAFCYTGGFSVSALAGGAESVISIDSSKPALELLEKNVALNFANAVHESRADDFFRSMSGLSREWNLIVLDPPAFVKDRRAINSGLKGYRSINEAAFRALPKGGLLFTFSCSQLVSRDDFRGAVFEAAVAANRTARVIAQLHQAPCHPVQLAHPEGDYLKGFVVTVD